MDEELINALKKRAKGYSFSEVQEEYSVTDGGEIALTKRKVCEKYCPPDTAALKTYMEIFKDEEISLLSDEELEREKHRLLVKLYEEEKVQKEKETQLALDCGCSGNEKDNQATNRESRSKQAVNREHKSKQTSKTK